MYSFSAPTGFSIFAEGTAHSLVSWHECSMNSPFSLLLKFINSFWFCCQILFFSFHSLSFHFLMSFPSLSSLLKLLFVAYWGSESLPCSSLRPRPALFSAVLRVTLSWKLPVPSVVVARPFPLLAMASISFAEASSLLASDLSRVCRLRPPPFILLSRRFNIILSI